MRLDERLVWVLVVSLKEVFVFVASVSLCVGKEPVLVESFFL